MNGMKRMLFGKVPATVASWLRNTKASVSVEFVAGAVLLLTITVGTLDVYRLIDTSSLSARAATTMSDYMSLAMAPEAEHLKDLARFSHREQIAVPSHAAFVISTHTQPQGDKASPAKQWDHQIVLTPEKETALSVADTCGSRTLIGTGGALPAGFAMEAGEAIIVVEVCVKVLPRALLSGNLVGAVLPSEFYQYRVLPVRDGLPAQP